MVGLKAVQMVDQMAALMVELMAEMKDKYSVERMAG